MSVNESNTLMFHKQTILSRNGNQTLDFKGLLWRTYSELDLFEMERINESIRKKEQIDDIDQ